MLRAPQIFMLDVKEQDRSRADGQVWKEDTQWACILDEGWDLGRVKQARLSFISTFTARVSGSEVFWVYGFRVSWLSQGTSCLLCERSALGCQTMHAYTSCRSSRAGAQSALPSRDGSCRWAVVLVCSACSEQTAPCVSRGRRGT